MEKIKSQLTFLDIGSRGELPKDWLWFIENNCQIKVHTFDIDLKAELKKNKNVLYENHNCGLSSNNQPRDFYLCEDMTTSSCFKPNPKTSIYESRHHQKRLKYKTLKLHEIKTIDEEFENSKKIDLIKCDTQGSELDISKGAQKTLLKACPIVAMETWCEDVYEELPLDFKIREFYNKIGYQLFASDTAASWRYESDNLFPLSRQRLIGENLLFVPSLEMFAKLDENDLLSKIPILCFFGFYDYSYQILKRYNLLNYLPYVKKLYSNVSKNNKFHNKIIRRITGKYSFYPRIT